MIPPGRLVVCVIKTVLTVLMFAVIVVHDTFIAEGLGFLALLAGADGVQFHGAAVVGAGLLARRLLL